MVVSFANPTSIVSIKKIFPAEFIFIALQIFLIYCLNAGGAFADFFGMKQLYAKCKFAQSMDQS